MVALYLSTRTGHFLCRWIWRRYVDKPLIRDEEDRLEKLKSPAVSIENLSPKSSSSSTSFDGSNSKTDSELFEKQQEIIRQSLTKKKWADRIKEQFRQFNAVLLMVVSGSQVSILAVIFSQSRELTKEKIIYSFALEPDTLARPYLSFLLSHSGLRAQYKHRDRDFLNLLGESLDASRVAGTSKILPGPDWIDSLDPAFPIERALSFAEVANSSIDHDFIMCKLQHPSSPHCSSAMVSMFYQEFWRALAMYGPLNAVSFSSMRYVLFLAHSKTHS